MGLLVSGLKSVAEIKLYIHQIKLTLTHLTPQVKQTDRCGIRLPMEYAIALPNGGTVRANRFL